MSMVPHRDQRICPVCGELREGGCHPCPGPRPAGRIDMDRITAAGRTGKHGSADLVMLPGDDPDEAARALNDSHAWDREEEWEPGG